MEQREKSSLKCAVISEDRVIIVAPGSSLDEEQIKLIENSDIFTIAIGDAGRVALPKADILYHCDTQWWEYYGGCPNFKGVKFSYEKTPFSHVTQLEPSDKKQGLDTNFPRIVTGINSGYQAINLAIHFKPKEIYLVGYDFKSGKKYNIIGDHPEEIKRPPYFEVGVTVMETLTKPLQNLGVSVYNCSKDTALTCFPMRSLEDAITRKKS